MKTWFRVFLFIAAFQMEVRVRASEDLLQQPEACLKSKEVCSLRANREVFHFHDKNSQWHLKPESSMEKVNDKQWRLTSGTVWVEKARSFKVETLFVEVQSLHGQFWVFEADDRVVVRNIDAELSLRLRDGTELPLPAGFQVWIAGINSKGKSEFGVLEAIDLKTHVKDWAPLYAGDLAKFRADVEKLKENWGPLAVKGGDIYQDLTDRKLASIAEDKRRVELKKQKALAEEQEMKRLYFEKVFER